MSVALPNLTAIEYLQRLQERRRACHQYTASRAYAVPSRQFQEQPAIKRLIQSPQGRAVVSYASIKEDAVRGEDTAGSDQLEESLSEEQIRRHVGKSAALIKRASVLVPNDEERAHYNVLLTIWRSIAEIPPANRLELLERLSPSEIKQLWQIAGKRYEASKDDVLNTLGPDFSLWDSFPEDAGQVAVYEGKAAVKYSAYFRKLFFLHPKTYELYGHVDVGWWPLGRILYPLYFKATIDASLLPGTRELTDMQLDYLPVAKLGLKQEDVPGELPTPRDARWPFSGGLCDYMRPVGPGVFVGRGWKLPPSARAAEGKDFLYFILVKKS